MRLTLLSVAYPLAPVGPDAVGGAEQVLTALDRALVRAGHRSIVVACEGSSAAQTLVTVPRPAGTLTDAVVAAARERHRLAIENTLQRWPVDVVHMHGIDFHHYLPQADVPVLATLHGPAAWYPPEALVPRRPDTWMHAVSADQHRSLPPHSGLLPPIENGVDLDALSARHAKRRFALMLSRIAPEKGVHLALDAASRAGLALLLAGEVFPYPEHQRYFAAEVQPRLDDLRRCIGPLGMARKRRFLTAARCLVIASGVPETSSLVAREALACGTPVVALAGGALADTIEHGRTGYLVSTVEDMAARMRDAGALDSEACRAAARARFSAAGMIAQYFALYRMLANGRAPAVAGAA
ncbi:MAG TPA: glycosyltransferase [Xanthobacteraceae bacterium]